MSDKILVFSIVFKNVVTITMEYQGRKSIEILKILGLTDNITLIFIVLNVENLQSAMILK